MINWDKKGLVFKPQETGLPWMVHHAYSPVVIQMEDSIWRCYFAGRNTENRASIGFFDVDLKRPNKVINISRKPILGLGPTGTFDCDGLIPASAIKINEDIYLYYSGWVRGWKEPLFRTAVGMGISHDGGLTFEKYSITPIFDWSPEDPISVICPCVFRNGQEYVMIYSSTEKWEIVNGEYNSWYFTKYAVSDDAIHWKRVNKMAIPPKEGENHVGRISVLSSENGFEGWYGYTREDDGQYRIGYGTSIDGKEWIRKDELAGICPSKFGWDSDAQAYPDVIEWNGMRYMFYNGNRFGFEGIGLAIGKEDA